MNALAKAFDALFGPQINFPDQDLVKWLNEQARYSPDLGWLEQLEFALLFCPDDTKSGHSRFCLVEEGVHLCTAYTQQPYLFWEQRVGDERIPIPLRAPEGAKAMDFGELCAFPQPRKIQGELRLIRTHQFRGLDTYKRNTVQFRRKRINVITPYREKFNAEQRDVDGKPLPLALQGKKGVSGPEMVHIVRCYMYEARPEYWDDLIDAGFRGFKPVRHFQSSRRAWLKEGYYAYPKENKSDGD